MVDRPTNKLYAYTRTLGVQLRISEGIIHETTCLVHSLRCMRLTSRVHIGVVVSSGFISVPVVAPNKQQRKPAASAQLSFPETSEVSLDSDSRTYAAVHEFQVRRNFQKDFFGDNEHRTWCLSARLYIYICYLDKVHLGCLCFHDLLAWPMQRLGLKLYIKICMYALQHGPWSSCALVIPFYLI